MRSAFAIALAAGLLSTASLACAASDPLVGSWVLNLSKTHYGGGATPRRRESFTCRARGAGVSCTIESVREDGRVVVGRFDASYDGLPHPTSGIPDVDHVALQKLNSSIVDATFTAKGKAIFGYRAVQSSDARTLTIISVDPVTRVVHESVVVYDRR